MRGEDGKGEVLEATVPVAGVKTLRAACWACGKKIKPDKAPRALCSDCAYGGYFGTS